MSMPAVNSKKEYIVSRVTWRGIELEVRHCPTWSSAAGMDHIEVVSDQRAPLSITDTGYKSLFILPELIAEHGTPVDYVLAWLDHEAETESWKRKEQDARQLCLF